MIVYIIFLKSSKSVYRVSGLTPRRSVFACREYSQYVCGSERSVTIRRKAAKDQYIRIKKAFLNHFVIAFPVLQGAANISSGCNNKKMNNMVRKCFTLTNN